MTRFAFQPLYSLHTGGAVALEALAKPGPDDMRRLLAEASRGGKLAELDIAFAAEATRQAAEQRTRLPLHLNLTAPTLVSPVEAFDPLLKALAEAGRRPREVVLEIGPPFSRLPVDALCEKMHELGELGFRLGLDGLGRADLPLTLLTSAPADLVKLDRETVQGLPGNPAALAMVEALLHFTSRTDLRLVATGLETTAQLAAVRELGLRLGQGTLFAETGPDPAWPERVKAEPEPQGQVTGPRVRDFLRPATTLPTTATCDDVRSLLADENGPSGIVGVDEESRPDWSVDRTRFLVAVTGPYGHALHAKRPAERLADTPHTIRADAGALEFLELVTDADWSRTGDDVVVVDASGRCLGVVGVTDVVRGVAEAKVEEAAALNPLTRLPGTDKVAREVDRRIAAGEQFVAAWLDVDSFKQVNDTAGFAAGDELIRELGRALTELASGHRRMAVGHVGGDDFLIACDVDEIAAVAARLLDTVWSAEGLPVTVSLATLVCGTGSIVSYREASRLLAPLKKRAKAVPGSSWVLGRPGSDRVDVLRGIVGRELSRPA